MQVKKVTKTATSTAELKKTHQKQQKKIGHRGVAELRTTCDAKIYDTKFMSEIKIRKKN